MAGAPVPRCQWAAPSGARALSRWGSARPGTPGAAARDSPRAVVTRQCADGRACSCAAAEASWQCTAGRCRLCWWSLACVWVVRCRRLACGSMGPSTPPASKKTGTPAALAMRATCKPQRTQQRVKGTGPQHVLLSAPCAWRRRSQQRMAEMDSHVKPCKRRSEISISYGRRSPRG